MYSESPYGKVLREFNEATDARYLTTHHERDKETGFDYRGARFYDSDLGRFLSLDPLAMEYPSYSDYSYVLGNPIRFIDPTGMAAENTIYIGTNGEKLGVSKDNLTDAVVEIDPSKVEQFKKEWAAAELAGTSGSNELNTSWRSMGTAFDIKSILAFYDGNTTDLDTDEGVDQSMGYLRENGAFLYNIDGLLTVGPERYVGGHDWVDWGKNNVNKTAGNAKLRASKMHMHFL